MVRVSGQSLLGILNDVLDFSKIEARKLELSPVDLRSTSGQCAGHADDAEQRAKALELAIRVDPRSRASCMAMRCACSRS
jgi:signal transduction histidine kinase